jgi:8-oxo-dGTP diphosphatase
MFSAGQPTTYVCGFMFEPMGGIVVMTLKDRPVWQAGKLNGVGGKIESGEQPRDAMVREFKEEAGLDTDPDQWREFATLSGPDFRVHFFRTFSHEWNLARTMESEQIVAVPTGQLFSRPRVPNLDFLIPLALNRDNLDIVHMTRAAFDEAKAA